MKKRWRKGDKISEKPGEKIGENTSEKAWKKNKIEKWDSNWYKLKAEFAEINGEEIDKKRWKKS